MNIRLCFLYALAVLAFHPGALHGARNRSHSADPILPIRSDGSPQRGFASTSLGSTIANFDYVNSMGQKSGAFQETGVPLKSIPQFMQGVSFGAGSEHGFSYSVKMINAAQRLDGLQDPSDAIGKAYKVAEAAMNKGAFKELNATQRDHAIAQAARMYAAQQIAHTYFAKTRDWGYADHMTRVRIDEAFAHNASNEFSRAKTKKEFELYAQHRGYLMDRLFDRSYKFASYIEQKQEEWQPHIRSLVAMTVLMGSAAYVFSKFGGTTWLKNKINQMFDRPAIYKVQQRKSGWFARGNDPNMVRKDDIVLKPTVRRQVHEALVLMNRRQHLTGAQKKKKFFFPRMLLHGPPGTGKTSIARMLADNAVGDNGKPMHFISLAATDFNKVKHIADRLYILDEMFAKAEKLGNCIIFLDEIEGMVRERGNEADPFLIKLMKLTEHESDRYMLIAATNHLKYIDSALRSRFTKKIEVEKPSVGMIRQILEKHIERYLLTSDYTSSLDAAGFAPHLMGCSGRDIRKMILNVQYRLDYEELNNLDDHIFYTVLVDMGWMEPSEEYGLENEELVPLDEARYDDNDSQEAETGITAVPMRVDDEGENHSEEDE